MRWPVAWAAVPQSQPPAARMAQMLNAHILAQALFAAGGVKLTRVTPTGSAINPMSILEGVPA